MRSYLSTTAIAFASFAVASGLVALADPANATAPDTDRASAIVQTSDLDLGAPAGRATARMRIGHAADRVCGYDGAMFSPSARCRRTAIDAADRALDSRIAAL